MDTTGCPANRATDRFMSVLIPGVNDEHKCKESLPVFWGMVSLSLFFRVMLSVLQIRIALFLINSRRDAAKIKDSVRKIPLTTFFECMHTVLVAIAWVLFGLDVANSHNGGGPAIFLLSILPMQISFLFSCVKIVHLGNKIIPKSVRSGLEKARKATKVEGSPISMKGNDEVESSANNLSRISADCILSFLFGGMILMQVFSVFMMVIIPPLINPGTSDVWSESGLIAQGIFCLFGFFIIARQTTRVTNYIENVHLASLKGAINFEVGTVKAVNRTVKMMKFRTILFGFSCVATIVIFFVCGSGAVFMSWPYVLAIFAGSMLCSLANTVMYMPKSFSPCGRSRNQQSSSKGHEGRKESKSDSRSGKAGITAAVAVANTQSMAFDRTITQNLQQGSVTETTSMT